MVRQRGAAVRYASKEAADSDKLLVKANRTLHVDICVSGENNNTAADSNVATAVGVQGWRKTMEDAHVVWLKPSSSTSNSRRFFRSFVCGALDTEHNHLHLHNNNNNNALSTTATSTHGADSHNDEGNQNRDQSPAPAHVTTVVVGGGGEGSNTTTPRMSQAPSLNTASLQPSSNNNNIDLLADPFLLPNNNHNHNPLRRGSASINQQQQQQQQQQGAVCENADASPTTTIISSPSSSSLNEQLSQELDQLSEGTSIKGYIAVFDGHGGDAASKFCGEHLGGILFKEIREVELSSATKKRNFSSLSSDEVQEVFNRSFLECDRRLKAFFFELQKQDLINSFNSANANTTQQNNNDDTTQNPSIFLAPASPTNTTNAGSTAAGAVIFSDSVILFSVGDCRSGVFSLKRHHHSSQNDDDDNHESPAGASSCEAEENSSGSSSSPIVVEKKYDVELLGKLDDDHRPGASEIERERLEKIGAMIANGRVGGKLSVSRAFGDFSFKKNGTSGSPYNNSNNNNNGSDDDEKDNDEYAKTKNPIYQFPVVCVPELRIIKFTQTENNNNNKDQSQSVLIAVGCDGVYETQELAKLPDLVLNHGRQPTRDFSSASTSPTKILDNQQQQQQQQQNHECSGSIFGTVRVAQRSISLSHPISLENGGLLPGSDNVTFITCLLRENFFTSSSSSTTTEVSQEENTKNKNEAKIIITTPKNSNTADDDEQNHNELQQVVHATEPLSPAQPPAQHHQGTKNDDGEKKLVLSPREKARSCC